MTSKSRMTIEVYNDEGKMHESIGGHMDFEGLKATMLSILKNDGIPIVRHVGKHAAKDQVEKPEASCIREWEQPMAIHIEYDGLIYSATGRYEDVLDAQNEFLQAILSDK